MSQRFENVEMNEIQKVKGLSSGMILITNAIHTSHTSAEDIINAYVFDREILASDADLRSITYGRVNSKGSFKACKIVVNTLARYYGNNAKFFITVGELQKIAEENNCNLGVAVEIWLCSTGFFKHGTVKQDKAQKIDIIATSEFLGNERKRYQVKASICTDKTKGSYATSNGKIWKWGVLYDDNKN